MEIKAIGIDQISQEDYKKKILKYISFLFLRSRNKEKRNPKENSEVRVVRRK